MIQPRAQYYGPLPNLYILAIRAKIGAAIINFYSLNDISAMITGFMLPLING
jgi:hypothetical protein